jgi:photosystem II stability/assembly factor-like uncharacterized protein
MLFYSLPAAAERADGMLRHEDIRENIYCCAMITDSVYLIAGDRGHMYRSEDGGKLWKEVDSGVRLPLFSVSFPDEQNGWICGKGGLILHSSDAGKTWKKQPQAVERHLFSISFGDSQKGCAVGDWGAVAVTSDGGKTWKDATLEEDVNLYGVRLAETGTGHLVGEFGRIFRTEDGGSSWTEIASPAEQTMFCLSHNGSSWFATGLAADVVDEATGQTKVTGVIVVSFDDGKTWEAIETGVEESLYEIVVEGDVGWAVGDVGTVLKTEDGGRSWQHVEVPVKKRLFWIGSLSLSKGNGNTGFGAGANGLFVGIQDGKLIW